jgi:hypothetical protein
LVTAPDRRQRVYVASGLNILAGLWLLLAPFALGYAGVASAMWNSAAIGIVVSALAILRVSKPAHHEGVSWTNCALGLWMIFAPFVLGHWTVAAAAWNDIIVGIVVVALAATSASATHMMREQPAHV